MTRLFADYFTVPVVDPALSVPEPIYDEERELSLDVDGHVFVERLVAGGPSRTETITKVRKEGPDISNDLSLLGTETRMQPSEREHHEGGVTGLETLTEIRGEREDPTNEYTGAEMLTTETNVHRERADADTGAVAFLALGTETAVPREGEDHISEVFLGAETHTFVHGEGEDLSHELGSVPERVSTAV